MAKSYSFLFALLCLLFFGSCQSLELISIDYMKPGDLTFPSQFKKVAIVNNASTTPDDELKGEFEEQKEKLLEQRRSVAYANGDIKITAESMAEEIARQNYFDEVVICDSALRAKDLFPRENTLSEEEVNNLSASLGVDCIIAIEGLQFKAIKKYTFIRNSGYYKGNIDIKLVPTIKVYLPGRPKPMAAITPKDSIFWEEFGISVSDMVNRLPSDKQILKEASEYAGITPVKNLLPYWTTGERFLYTDGSVSMRDAAVYVREDSWDKAHKLWNQAYESTKNKKMKMKLALNIALYYEMTDSIPAAEEWAMKAQQYAKTVDNVDNWQKQDQKEIYKIPNYYRTTLYTSELKERMNTLPRLKAQMQRFKE